MSLRGEGDPRITEIGKSLKIDMRGVHCRYQSSTSSGSPMPSALMLKRASLSGRQGESYTLHFLFAPRCFERKSRVVEA